MKDEIRKRSSLVWIFTCLFLVSLFMIGVYAPESVVLVEGHKYARLGTYDLWIVLLLCVALGWLIRRYTQGSKGEALTKIGCGEYFVCSWYRLNKKDKNPETKYLLIVARRKDGFIVGEETFLRLSEDLVRVSEAFGGDQVMYVENTHPQYLLHLHPS